MGRGVKASSYTNIKAKTWSVSGWKNA